MTLEELAAGVEARHGGRAFLARVEHVELPAWRGPVAVFRLVAGPAPLAFAWSEGDGMVAVLAAAPVVDPTSAVQSALDTPRV